MLKEINRRILLDRFLNIFLVLSILLLESTVQGHAAAPFSFIAVGDTRTEPYLTGGPRQKEVMKTVLQKRYHNKPVRLFFDPEALTLERAEVQEGRDDTLSLYYQDGWPRLIVQTGNGSSRVMMRAGGRRWVFDRIVSAIRKGAQNQTGGALFLVHGGDIPVFGYQGTTLDESPYWQLFDDELLSRLPPPDKDLGLRGRVLAAVGNHETWEDETLSGFFTTMPWLKELGLSWNQRMYAVSFRNCRFIFLDSGGSKKGSYSDEWTSEYPDFNSQMKFLADELSVAVNTGVDHVFIIYHKPSFVKVGHDPLPMGQNPHQAIKKFANDLKIVVFNSHTHTTEHYVKEGVHYVVLGGGGAPQKFDLTTKPSPEEELYWQGKERVEEYNYLQVEVNGPHTTGVIHRFRPTDPSKPMSAVEVFRR
jgi:hypothetical protein